MSATCETVSAEQLYPDGTYVFVYFPDPESGEPRLFEGRVVDYEAGEYAVKFDDLGDDHEVYDEAQMNKIVDLKRWDGGGKQGGDEELPNQLVLSHLVKQVEYAKFGDPTGSQMTGLANLKSKGKPLSVRPPVMLFRFCKNRSRKVKKLLGFGPDGKGVQIHDKGGVIKLFNEDPDCGTYKNWDSFTKNVLTGYGMKYVSQGRKRTTGKVPICHYVPTRGRFDIEATEEEVAEILSRNEIVKKEKYESYGLPVPGLQI